MGSFKCLRLARILLNALNDLMQLLVYLFFYFFV